MQDLGTPPLRTSEILTIRVTDVNDNPPQFDQATYATSIYENASMVRGKRERRLKENRLRREREGEEEEEEEGEEKKRERAHNYVHITSSSLSLLGFSCPHCICL